MTILDLVPVELWSDKLKGFDLKDFDEEIEIGINNIIYLKGNMEKNLYHTTNDGEFVGWTILCHLLWLHACFDMTTSDIKRMFSCYGNNEQEKIYQIFQFICDGIYQSFVGLVKCGFDVNKEYDNDVQLYLPMALLLNTDVFTVETRTKFFTILVENGADIHKTNIWTIDGNYDNFKVLVEDWVSLDAMGPVVSSALHKINGSNKADPSQKNKKLIVV